MTLINRQAVPKFELLGVEPRTLEDEISDEDAQGTPPPNWVEPLKFLGIPDDEIAAIEAAMYREIYQIGESKQS